MLSFDDICKLAYAREELPEAAFTLPEQNAYEIMCRAYADYEQSRATKEDCAKRKADAKQRYQHDCLFYRIYIEYHDREIAIDRAGLMGKIEKSDCPYCKELVRILDGREQI